MSQPILADAFGHHCWGTIRLIDACLPLTPEQLGTAAAGTYGPIIDTLRHLVGSDASYLHVLSGGTVAEVDASAMDLAGLRAVMERQGPAWAALVAQSHDPDEMLTRRRPDGSESRAPRSIRLAQALHHGTDHRSQVCSALTALGIAPPDIDVWDYAWERGQLTETAAS